VRSQRQSTAATKRVPPCQECLAEHHLAPVPGHDRSCDRIARRDSAFHHTRRMQRARVTLRSSSRIVLMQDFRTMHIPLRVLKAESWPTTYMASRTFAGDH
jgi:hypothetical protein